jgi:hypothetical protein
MAQNASRLISQTNENIDFPVHPSGRRRILSPLRLPISPSGLAEHDGIVRKITVYANSI